MKAQLDSISRSERLRRLYAMDLEKILKKAREPLPEGKGWTQAQCNEADKWYRRFWHAIIVHPDACHVPNGPIDDLWHLHILDTKAYRSDCTYVLGYFLDHWPYYGMNGDAVQRDASFKQTNEIYMSIFGETCDHMVTFRSRAVGCGDGDGSGCGSDIATPHARSCGLDDVVPPLPLAASCGNQSEAGCVSSPANRPMQEPRWTRGLHGGGVTTRLGQQPFWLDQPSQ